MSDMWAHRLVGHLDGRTPGLPAWIKNMPEAVPVPARPPAWVRNSQPMPRWLAGKPGKPVDAVGMLHQLASGIDAIEAKRKARARRNAPKARAAMAAYEKARAEFAGEVREGPSTFVAACLGLDSDYQPHIF